MTANSQCGFAKFLDEYPGNDAVADFAQDFRRDPAKLEKSTDQELLAYLKERDEDLARAVWKKYLKSRSRAAVRAK